MKYIKRFNESSNQGLYDDIKQVIKVCLEEYCTDYDMITLIEDGLYINNLSFIRETDIENLSDITKDEIDKIDKQRCVKVTMINESTFRLRGSRLEIYLDENSQNLFDESIEMLKNQLNMITNEYKILQLPKELKTTFWQIQFLIVYR